MKLYKIKQHFPSYYDSVFKREINSFTDKKTLLEIEFVKVFSEMDNFYKYSISENCLIAEYKKGCEWSVVGKFMDSNDGYISDLNELEKIRNQLKLPKFSFKF